VTAPLTVGAGLPRSLLDFAAARGARRSALVRRAGLEPGDLRHPDNRVALHKYVALMRAAQELSGDPALALHYGEAVDLSQISIVGHIDQGIASMEDAFAMIDRYGALVVETGGPRPRFLVERRGHDIWIIDRRQHPNEFPELTESTFARIVCGARRFFGENRLLKAVHVTHPAPAYRAEYERVFQARVVFESDRNALVYDAAWWARKLAGGSPVSDVVAAHADRLLDDLEASKTTVGRVESLLAARLESGDLSMAGVADALGLSRPTLLRRLRAEGTTFAQLLDRVRRETALEYVRERRLSVKETAYRVGFSEAAALSRAFKRWTGRSPRDFAVRSAEGRRRS
jgi:AraC-like DNA-binding protein